MRSNQMFGPEDRLLNWFAVQGGALPFIPLIDSGSGVGGDALTKPVYMGDVSDAIFRIIMKHENYAGCTFEIEGDQDFNYRELAEFVYDITGQKPTILPVPKEIMLLGAKGAGMMPSPILNEDQIHLWSNDYVGSGGLDETGGEILTLSNLDLTPTKIEKVAFSYLHRFRAGGHFIMNEGYHIHASNEKVR